MQALENVTQAMNIIEQADQRALAFDGPAGHVRDTMTDQEWRSMYKALARAERNLKAALRAEEVGTTAERVGN